MAIPKKLRQHNNEEAVKLLAAGVGGMMVLFVLIHWTRTIYKRFASARNGLSGILEIPVTVTRIIRSVLLRKVPGFVSAGHNLVFLGYIGTNLAITFTRIDWTNLVSISKRLGWTTVANLALVIFLSLKNTPLGFLTSYSYERLQPLHQVAGYTTIACWFMHAVVYLTAWDKSHNLHEMLELDNVMGIVSGISLLIILASTLLRARHYEIFYVLHIVFALLVLITAGLHRPQLAKKSSYAVVFAGAIWGFDRLIRVARVALYGVGNTATLVSLPHGGTKVVLKRNIVGAKAGQHIFLYLPAIRRFQTHPFTIASVGPVELVIAAQDGFTKDLHALAVRSPVTEIRASVDGAYGSIPDLRGVSKVLFIAGGSGGSYTTGVAAEILRASKDDVNLTIEFVWVVRHTEMLNWFEPHLAELTSSPRVTMDVHVTHHLDTPSASPSSSDLSEKVASRPLSPADSEKVAPFFDKETSVIDIEKRIAPSTQRGFSVLDGRPDVPSLIVSFVASASKSDRLAVVACGPGGMMLQVRRAVASNLRVGGPSLELHSEAFGW